MAKKTSIKKVKVKESEPSKALTGHQLHGAVQGNPAKLLTELLGRGKTSPFGSYSSLAEYSTALKGMTLNELHIHAVEDAEIVPIDDRNRLIERLEKEFSAYQNKLANYEQRAKQNANPLPPENKAAIEKILSKTIRF